MWTLYILFWLVLAYAALVLVMFLAQTWIIFPARLATLHWPALPTVAERLEFDVDGVRLVGVRIPGTSEPGRRPVLLGFGGNGWNGDRMALYLHGLFPDCEVIAFHYRGYPPSTGRPSARALLADAVAVFDRLAEQGGGRPVVAVGFSIGSAVAAFLARERELAGLILVTPFDSLERLARDQYFWAPVRLLLRHRLPTVEFVRELATPTALIAAERDRVVPARRCDPLRRAIPNLVYDRVIAGAGHNDIYDRPAFAAAMREALAQILNRQSSGGRAGVG